MKIALPYINSGLLFVLSAATLAAQCSLYVAPSGNDTNPGTLTAPFATPVKAVQAAPSGATVCLRGGTYNMAAPAIIEKPLTLMSYPGEAARLVAPISNNAIFTVIAVYASDITVQGLEVVGGAYFGIKVSPDYSVPTANVRISQCKIHDTGRDAIKAYMADGLIIEDSEAYNTGKRDASNAEGLDIMSSIPTSTSASAYGVIVRRNYVHDTATTAIQVKGGARRVLVERNHIDTSNLGGILLGGVSDAQFMRDGTNFDCIDCVAQNNVISNTRGYGLGCMGGSDIEFYNNTAVNVATIQAGFWVMPNDLGAHCTITNFQNNVVSLAPASKRPLVHFVSIGTYKGDYNTFFSSGKYQFWQESPAAYKYVDFAGWQQLTGQEIRSLTGDSLLNAADLKPLASSPLILRGISVPGLIVDYSGAARPAGSAVTIGALEPKN